MSQLERKIADLILLIPSDQQHFARKRIDNLIINSINYYKKSKINVTLRQV